MDYVNVRRNFYFYGKLAFSAFSILFAIAIYYFSIDITTDPSLDADSNISSIFPFIFGTLFFIGGCYTFLTNLRIFPSLRYNDFELIIGKNKIRYDEILKITFSGKFPNKGINYNNKEGICIKTTNKEFVIYYGYYYNFHLFVQFLEQKRTNRKNHKVVIFNEEEHSLDNIREFSGIIWINHRFIVVYLYWGFLIFLAITSGGSILLGGMIFIPFYYIFSKQFYYFQISDEWLVVKNHHLFWEQYYFKCSDIKKVSYEIGINRRPDKMVILLKNYDYQSYFAASLTDKTWERFLNDLKEKGVHTGTT